MSRLISFVIPCYGSERTIEDVVNEILDLNSEHPEDEYEIILVNDCSPDHVWDKICMLTYKHSNIRGINLCRNFASMNQELMTLDFWQDTVIQMGKLLCPWMMMDRLP